MMFKSTRDSAVRVSASEAILKGLSADGGLFVPESFPELTLDDLEGLSEKPYQERAIEVLSLFLSDFSDEQLVSCVERAYSAKKFGSDSIIRIEELNDTAQMLELWHGPTCAFKDMALQILPHLLTTSAQIQHCENEIVILVATSGDTGKAALEGFCDVPGTRMIVFYPEDGVSPMQKRQMTTQEGENVAVCAIKGNFDDAQTAVKTIFVDEELRASMEKNGKQFSSANSINWGRLVPQVVYYVAAYAQLVQDETIKLGDTVNVCVPTGNFGNILAAYYAKKMGVPFGKLICASNENNVLTDFIRTGTYDKNRAFHATISPSMDILISSNLERLLYDLCGEDDAQVRAWYDSLAKTGTFTISDEVKEKLSEHFYGGCCDDTRTKETIREAFEEESYLCDTHTAVAVSVYEDYKKETGDDTLTLIASTANPYKFAQSVLSAVYDELPEDEYDQIDTLCRLSGLPVPKALSELKEKPVRFTGSIPRENIKETVAEMLNL